MQLCYSPYCSNPFIRRGRKDTAILFSSFIHSSRRHLPHSFLIFCMEDSCELSPLAPTMAEEDSRSDMPTQPFTLEQCAWLHETFGTGASYPALSQPVMSAAGALPPPAESKSSDPQLAHSTSASESMVVHDRTAHACLCQAPVVPPTPQRCEILTAKPLVLTSLPSSIPPRSRHRPCWQHELYSELIGLLHE